MVLQNPPVLRFSDQTETNWRKIPSPIYIQEETKTTSACKCLSIHLNLLSSKLFRIRDSACEWPSFVLSSPILTAENKDNTRSDIMKYRSWNGANMSFSWVKGKSWTGEQARVWAVTHTHTHTQDYLIKGCHKTPCRFVLEQYVIEKFMVSIQTLDWKVKCRSPLLTQSSLTQWWSARRVPNTIPG